MLFLWEGIYLFNFMCQENVHKGMITVDGQPKFINLKLKQNSKLGSGCWIQLNFKFKELYRHAKRSVILHRIVPIWKVINKRNVTVINLDYVIKI